MRRVTSRPRLVSDGDRAFINATIDDEISHLDDSGGSYDKYLLDLYLDDTGGSYQKYPRNSTTADLSQRINCSDEPDKPPSAAVVEDDTHTPIQNHDGDFCYLEYMPSRNASNDNLLDSLSYASVGIAPLHHHAATKAATDESKMTSKRKRFSRQHYYIADPSSSMSRHPGMSGTLSECSARDSLDAGQDRNDSEALGLAQLPEENVIGVSSYLTLQEVRQLSATSTAMRKILAGKFRSNSFFVVVWSNCVCINTY